MLQSKASASGGEKENHQDKMDKVHRAVLYKTLHNHGGGILLLRDRVDNSPVIALIGRRGPK